jgi:hypothetical protein
MTKILTRCVIKLRASKTKFDKGSSEVSLNFRMRLDTRFFMTYLNSVSLMYSPFSHHAIDVILRSSTQRFIIHDTHDDTPYLSFSLTFMTLLIFLARLVPVYARDA